MILSIKWLILQSGFSRGRRNGIIVSKVFLSSSVITELSSVECSVIVLGMCIQDKAQADDERMLGHKHMNTNLNLLTASQSYIKIASKISAIK